MAKSLIVVESPAKAKTIKKYLGKGFSVVASMGHVMDLPKSRLGVDVEKGFEPKYMKIREKKKIIDEIRKKAKEVDNIFLASDPDREGEAIAWHIALILGDRSERIKRVLFNEITKKGIEVGMKNPRTLDKNLYEAQVARRILDRLVGYKLSPLLWSKVQKRLSAGRVQSIALKLVCDREREIEAFSPEEYWTVTALLKGKEPPDFKGKLVKVEGKKASVSREEEASKIIGELKGSSFTVEKVKRKERRRNPLPPFTTSTLQQEGWKKLKYSATKTMRIAQTLYEGVELEGGEAGGLITYMRTDSVRISDEAISGARELIGKQFGKNYLPSKGRVFKNKKGAQDAHEAIRPTNVFTTPEKVKKYLGGEQLKLYTLIWERFLASQMAPARFDHTSVDILAGRYLFRATGQVPIFKGFLEVYEEKPEKEDNERGKKEVMEKLPHLEEGELLTLKELVPDQHFTQPPPRFSESSLIKMLEEKGIGRPSTYASIIRTIKGRKYVLVDERKFLPTELGIIVSDLLTENFPRIMDVKFTADLEGDLDKIGEGTLGWRDAVERFYGPFESDLEKAKIHMEKVKERLSATGISCDRCEGEMVIRVGRNGRFLACTNYPECTHTLNFVVDKDGKVEVLRDIPSGIMCDECGQEMNIRRWKGGRYLVCSSQECTHTKPFPVGVTCPSCDKGEIVEKVSRRGKLFYSCSEYPGCTYASWKEPVARECPECGNGILLRKVLRKGGTVLECMIRGCKGRVEESEPGS